ncbi:unnamed protein product [Calypogeia fissa]
MEAINRWDALPEECKSMILSRLSTKEVARIARVSKEFLKAVNVLRSSVQLLVLPPTLSATGLEGMVTAHPNVRSLSFKRCGAKLKSFVPIVKAAATGYTTVAENDRLDSPVTDKKKLRSLKEIDFRNCANLIDTDISILCSLHTTLEKVDLTNCPFMTDTALLTLSRYQHFEKPIAPLDKYNCYPRVFDKASKLTSDTFTEAEEMFLKDTDAALFEEIQGLGLNSNNFRSWPRIGERSRKESTTYPQFSSRKYEEGKIIAASPYAGMSRRDYSAAGNPNMGPKKSYAQMAASSLERPRSSSPDLPTGKSTPAPHTYQPAQPTEPNSPASLQQKRDPEPSSIQSTMLAHLDPSITFIDWNVSDATKAARYDSQALNNGSFLSSSELRSSGSDTLAADDISNSEIDVTNRYRDMYKHYLIDEVEKPPSDLPDLISKLCLSTAKDLSQAYYNPTSIQSEQNGSHYIKVETGISDNQMMRTQTSLFVPKLPVGGTFSKQKAICVAVGTEIRDQRVQIEPARNGDRVTAEELSEAFCRTINEVGVYAVPDADSDQDEPREGTSRINYPENGTRPTSGESDSPSHLAICLPDSANIGGMLRRNMQSMCQENFLGSDRSVGNDLPSELDIDVSRSVPGLRAVSVASCPEITDRGVQALLKGTSRTCLATLDVSRCGGVTNAGLKLPARSGLQQLIAVQMPAISRLVYQLPIQSVLQHLNLAGCYKLEELLLVTSSLKTLNLSNCKKLARLHLKCPSLIALNLSLCDGMERFFKFQCDALQSLNVMGCRMLLQSSLTAAVDSAPSLEDLRCGGCDRVERLDLVQSTLLTLDVSGSQSLKRLFCQSKVLRVVDACGCKCLVEVYLYSAYLRRMLFSNCALLQTLVIPLDAIKETMDTAASRSKKDGNAPLDELEIAISGCNMPETVKKNLAKLTKQWQSCFKTVS